MILLAALILLALLLFFGRQTRKAPLPSLAPPFDLYVINLDRAAARMQRFLKDLQNTDLSGVAPIRVRAVDGSHIDIESHVTKEALQEIKLAERNGYRQRHYELTRGAVGCYLSHLDVWDRLLSSDKSFIMVCEDDAVLDPQIGRRTKEALESLPVGWDLLLLGYWCVRCDRQQGFKKMHRFFGLHCYLISRPAVAKIRAYAGDKVGQQVDSMLSDMCSEGRLDVYGVEEKAAVQTGTNSSVQLPLRAKAGIDAWAALPAVRAVRSLATA